MIHMHDVSSKLFGGTSPRYRTLVFPRVEPQGTCLPVVGAVPLVGSSCGLSGYCSEDVFFAAGVVSSRGSLCGP